jgi:hypothetical protein
MNMQTKVASKPGSWGVVHLVALIAAVTMLVSCASTVDRAKELSGQDTIGQRVPDKKPKCTDILKKWKTKPDDLVLKGCSDSGAGGIAKLDYNYEVAGTKATLTEAVLMKQYGMQPLKFVCCGWEPAMSPSGARLGFTIDGNGYHYEISMGSGETIERDWNKIDRFYVTVSLYLEVV